MEINKLMTAIAENNKAKGFRDREFNVGEVLMLIVSELGEAMEAHRKGMFNYVLKQDTVPDDFEQWKEVDGFEGEYEVSNLGRVRSLDMVVAGGGSRYYTKEGRVLAPGLGGTGYNTVSLKGNSYKVSRLVALAFVDGYKEGLLVNHINGIKTDDYANNLEWVTASENNNHAIKSGLRSPQKTLTKEQTIDIAFLCKQGIPHKEIHILYPQISLSRIKTISRQKEKFTDSFEFELADAFIRILDLSERIGIDLQWFVDRKMKFNATRPHLHGKAY